MRFTAPRLARRILPALGLLFVGTAAHAQFTAYGVTTGAGGTQRLVRFNTANPTNVTTVGLTGANLTGIDFRPATGVLYGYDGTSLYTINLSTGAATQLFGAGVTTGNAGFDFNPTVDRIRIVDAAGTNLRANPADGVTLTDGSLAYAPGDAGAGQAPNVTAVAYTNSDTDPLTATTLYGLDASRGTLVTIAPPNDGVVNTVGSLGIGAFSNVAGFDIVTVGGMNSAFFAALGAGGMPMSSFYGVDLTTGAATLLGSVRVAGGLQGLAVTSLAPAVIPEPGTWALLATGLVGLGVGARQRRRAAAE